MSEVTNILTASEQGYAKVADSMLSGRNICRSSGFQIRSREAGNRCPFRIHARILGKPDGMTS